MRMKQTCLVTGASGFIGRHLLASLTREGHPVLALLRQPQQLAELRLQVDALGGCGAKVSAVKGDLARAGLGLDAADQVRVREAGVVFHLGAHFAWRLPMQQARAVNVEGALQVADLAAATDARLLMVGGFMLHNHAHLQRLGVNLEQPAMSDWPLVYRRSGGYEGSKLEAHFAVQRRMREHGGRLTMVHPVTLCGHSISGHILPAQPLAGLITNLAHGRLSAIPGSPQHWLPLVCVDFLVELMRRAAFDPTLEGGELLALDERSPNLAGLLERLARMLQVKPPRRHLPVGLLRSILRIPGLPALLHTEPESLDFIQTQRFDMRATEAFVARHQLAWPDLDGALQASARYLFPASCVDVGGFSQRRRP
jgi:nucleoside-diphosphate-sugar epimerase